MFWPLDKAYYVDEVMDIRNDDHHATSYNTAELQTVEIGDKNGGFKLNTLQNDHTGADGLQGGVIKFLTALPSKIQEFIGCMLEKLRQRPFWYH